MQKRLSAGSLGVCKTAKFSYIGVFFRWRIWYTRLSPVNRNIVEEEILWKCSQEENSLNVLVQWVY